MTKRKHDRRPHSANIAFDEDGKPLPFAPSVVDDTIDKAFAHPDSELRMVVFALHGDMMVKVMGPPSQEIVTFLERLTETFRKAMRGQ